MADMLPKIIEAAEKQARVIVRCSRPARMAKELRKHLPEHVVTFDEAWGAVVVERRVALALEACSTGAVCAPAPRVVRCTA